MTRIFPHSPDSSKERSNINSTINRQSPQKRKCKDDSKSLDAKRLRSTPQIDNLGDEPEDSNKSDASKHPDDLDSLPVSPDLYALDFSQHQNITEDPFNISAHNAFNNNINAINIDVGAPTKQQPSVSLIHYSARCYSDVMDRSAKHCIQNIVKKSLLPNKFLSLA